MLKKSYLPCCAHLCLGVDVGCCRFSLTVYGVLLLLSGLDSDLFGRNVPVVVILIIVFYSGMGTEIVRLAKT